MSCQGTQSKKKSQPYTEVGCRRAAEALRSMKPGRSSRGEANSLHPPPKKERSWGSGFKGLGSLGVGFEGLGFRVQGEFRGLG